MPDERPIVKCKSSIYQGMLTIDLDDGDWKLWSVHISIIFDKDARPMHGLTGISAGERNHGIVHLRLDN